MPEVLFSFEIKENGSIICITGESCEKISDYEFLIDGKNKISFGREVHQLRSFLVEDHQDEK